MVEGRDSEGREGIGGFRIVGVGCCGLIGGYRRGLLVRVLRNGVGDLGVRGGQTVVE